MQTHLERTGNAALTRWLLVILTTLPVGWISNASAARLIVSASYSLPAPPGEFPAEDSEFVIINPSAPGEVLTRTANTLHSYTTVATEVGALATASASETDLRVGATLVIQDFDPAIVGEGFFVDTLAILQDTYETTSALAAVFGSPVFRITGNLSSDSSDLQATVGFFSSQLGGTLYSQSAGPPGGPPIDFIVPTPAIDLTGPAFFDFRLSANIESRGTAFPPGDYNVIADFTSTVSLLGFALFEDAAMTRPILDGVTVRGANGDGAPLPVLDLTQLNPNPVPLPAAAWLFATALLGLAGFGSNRGAARARIRDRA